MPGLDGLRAIAVIAVLLYHADLLWIPGGFLGVEVFFVISGFLITSLLLRERDRSGRTDLKRFWMRRARRLLPALFAMLVVTALYVVLFMPQEMQRLRGDYLAAFTYVTNWFLILKNESYFESMGRPSILKHLWSLAVEEQFYILWPMLFAAGVALLRRRGMLVATVLAALASTALMWMLFVPGQDPSRVYYGTDTRAAGLLLGAALAFIWAPWRVHDLVLSRLRRLTVDVLGVLGLIVVVAMFLGVSEYGSFLYRGGFLLLGLATLLLIASTVLASGYLGRALGVAPLRWVGLRSYSIYLWHWPVYMVTRPGVDIMLFDLPLLALRLVITVVLADLSYRFVEQPVRTGAAREWVDSWRDRMPRPPSRRSIVASALVLTPLFVLAVLSLPRGNASSPALGALAQAAPPPTGDNAPPNAGFDPTSLPLPNVTSSPRAESTGTSPGTQRREADRGPGTVPPPRFAIPDRLGTVRASLATVTPGTVVAAAPAGTQDPSGPAARRAASVSAQDEPGSAAEGASGAEAAAGGAGVGDLEGPDSKPVVGGMATARAAVTMTPLALDVGRVTFLGDSVMLSAEYALEEVFGPAANIDASVSRQFYAGVDAMRFLRDTNQLGDAVVIHLGNNGAINSQMIDDMMEVLDGVDHVYFLTVKVPRRWEGIVNNALQAGAQRHPRMTLIDWHAASIRRPELFREDGVHLRPDGARFYAELIASQMQ